MVKRFLDEMHSPDMRNEKNIASTATTSASQAINHSYGAETTGLAQTAGQAVADVGKAGGNVLAVSPELPFGLLCLCVGCIRVTDLLLLIGYLGYCYCWTRSIWRQQLAAIGS